MELRPMRCPTSLLMTKISLMETGTKLIRGTALIGSSHHLTKDEKNRFSNILQARSWLRTCAK